ncbi:nucleoside deaminase [Lentzea sp. NPDC051208]|uniref:nucleoside deaminase n=1 Tax=Lentzea sp. NPDC051208 TaxID=3154642 RepID=UPI00342CA9FC
MLLDVDSGQVTHRSGNTVHLGDATAHAEMNLLREAARSEVALTRSVVVTTAEPCPMCAAAAVFSRVAGIAYGMPAARLSKYGWLRFDVSLTALLDGVVSRALTRPSVAGGVLTVECLELFRQRPRCDDGPGARGAGG